MVVHTCKKCGKKFDRKFNYTNHINKKYSCDINIKFDAKEQDDDDSDDNKIKNPLECVFCSKVFSAVYNLNKHIKNNCKVKKENDNEKENIFKELIDKEDELAEEKKKNLRYEKMIETLEEKVNNLEKDVNCIKKKKPSKVVNNITNNNNTNNIIMINNGKENLEIIDKREFINRIVKDFKITGLRIPNELLKLIHFNDKYPELKNIYISDINRNKCMIYDNDKWQLSAVDKIPEIVDKIVKYSNEQNEELSEQYKNNKNVVSRLKVIDKYTKLADDEHLQDLIENDAPKKDIDRCKKFKQDTHDLIKVSLYNEGKNIKN
jgi:hypothetical protein